MRHVAVTQAARDGSYSANVPDPPGCVLCGGTPAEAEEPIGEAIQSHEESARTQVAAVPTPAAQTITVPAA